MSDLGNKEIMAANIKQCMKISGLCATDVCRMLKIPQATFNYWLHAKTYPRIDKIEMMAKLFGVSKTDLIEKRKSISDKSDGLTETEFAFIQLYRRLNEEEQKKLTIMIRALTESQE